MFSARLSAEEQKEEEMTKKPMLKGLIIAVDSSIDDYDDIVSLLDNTNCLVSLNVNASCDVAVTSNTTTTMTKQAKYFGVTLVTPNWIYDR